MGESGRVSAADAATITVTSATYANGTLNVAWTLTGSISFLNGWVVTLYTTQGTGLQNFPTDAAARTLQQAATVQAGYDYNVIVTALQASVPAGASQPYPVTVQT